MIIIASFLIFDCRVMKGNEGFYFPLAPFNPRVQFPLKLLTTLHYCINLEKYAAFLNCSAKD